MNGKCRCSQRNFASNEHGTSIAAVTTNTSWRAASSRITSWQSGMTASSAKNDRVEHRFRRLAVCRRDAVLEMAAAQVGGRDVRAERGVVATEVLAERVGHHFVHVDGDAQAPALPAPPSGAPIFLNVTADTSTSETTLAAIIGRRAIEHAVDEPEAQPGEIHREHRGRQLGPALPLHLRTTAARNASVVQHARPTEHRAQLSARR